MDVILDTEVDTEVGGNIRHQPLFFDTAVLRVAPETGGPVAAEVPGKKHVYDPMWRSKTTFITVEDTISSYRRWLDENDIKENTAEAKSIKFKGESKERSWAFTINNPTSDDWKRLLSSKARYICGQVEVGAQGTPHIQGFLYFKNAVVKPVKMLPRASLEKAKMPEEYMCYCTKEDTRIAGPFEIGTPIEPGRRSDLETIAVRVRDGMTLAAVAQEEPAMFSKYHRGLTALRNITRKHRTGAPVITWIWGVSGQGKTKMPQDVHGRQNCYIKDGTCWWDGYDQQDCVIIDDFDKNAWPIRQLFKLLDEYECQTQIKGDYVKINSPYIYITCEFHPDTYYDDGSPNTLVQLKRRLMGGIFNMARTAGSEPVKMPPEGMIYSNGDGTYTTVITKKGD